MLEKFIKKESRVFIIGNEIIAQAAVAARAEFTFLPTFISKQKR